MSDRREELMARIGLDPAAEPTEPTAADTTAWLVEQAAGAIDRITPKVFTKPYPIDPRVGQWVTQFVADPANAESLLLLGPTGTGKTHQGYQALRAAVAGAYRRNIRPTFRAVSHPDFTAVTRPGGGEGHVEALAKYSTAGLLLVDDLGAEDKATEWSSTTLYRLVNARWENGLPTIWTTNRNAAELTALVGDRVVSRVWQSQRVLFSGPDLRKASA